MIYILAIAVLYLVSRKVYSDFLRDECIPPATYDHHSPDDRPPQKTTKAGDGEVDQRGVSEQL